MISLFFTTLSIKKKKLSKKLSFTKMAFWSIKRKTQRSESFPSYSEPPRIMVIDKDCPSPTGTEKALRKRRRSSLAAIAIAQCRDLASSSTSSRPASPQPKHYGSDSGSFSGFDSEDSLSSTGGDSGRSGSVSSGSASPLAYECSTSGRRRRSSSSSNPNVRMWAALRRGKFEKVYEILLAEWKKNLTQSSVFGEEEDRVELDVNLASSEGVTSLHLCAFAGNPRCVRLLLALGANPSAGDNDNWTPIHAASVQGLNDILVMLACSGASLRAKDRQGRTPSDVASSDETKALLKKLRKLEKRNALLSRHESIERLVRSK